MSALASAAPASAELSSNALYDPNSFALPIFDVPAGFDEVVVTDVEPVDFDGDGAPDLAVAWFASDFQNFSTRIRQVSIFRNENFEQLVPWFTVNAYQRDPLIESRSIFRNGTSELAVGDFDGDGDPDFAVLPYFGDELWFVENLGGAAVQAHVKFMFGSNSVGNFTTPPASVVADFDGDGRVDLAYLVDASQRIDGAIVHFWSTKTTLASTQRRGWTATSGAALGFTRGLTSGDFNADGRPDLAFSGSTDPQELAGAVLRVWTGFSEGLFTEATYALPFLTADLVTLPGGSQGCRDPIVATDLSAGNRLARLSAGCGSGGPFVVTELFSGFQGTAGGRGNALTVADLNFDGELDVVARKRAGSDADPRQVEYVFGSGGVFQFFEQPLSTLGISNNGANQLLRPRNLAAADFMCNRGPEIVAAFNPIPFDGLFGPLEVRVWSSACRSDVNLDGVVNLSDLLAVLATFGACGDHLADVDRSGCVNLDDVLICQSDFGCTSGE